MSLLCGDKCELAVHGMMPPCICFSSSKEACSREGAVSKMPLDKKRMLLIILIIAQGSLSSCRLLHHGDWSVRAHLVSWSVSSLPTIKQQPQRKILNAWHRERRLHGYCKFSLPHLVVLRFERYSNNLGIWTQPIAFGFLNKSVESFFSLC